MTKAQGVGRGYRGGSCLTDTDRAALLRLRKPDGSMRRTPPRWQADPLAWAAWQGIHTALGYHGEGATGALLLLGPDARATWDRVSDAALALRREMLAPHTLG